MLKTPVYFWQRIVTPHMANLADALAVLGCEVVYVANTHMSGNRAQLGWAAPQMQRALLYIAADAETVASLAQSAPADSTHICQGLRGNGLVGIAQQVIVSRGLPHWVVMETVNDSGTRGLFKRIGYRWLFWRWHKYLQGILAIGWETSSWLEARGMNRDKIFSFAYFLPDSLSQISRTRSDTMVFRFLFVAQLIELKRVDQLVQALTQLTEQPFELIIIGDGPMRNDLKVQAKRLLAGRVRWLGRLPMTEIPKKIANADCLVLPSRHDGWGAVVSEALMIGTPVICSDACGAAGVVRASGVGGVFPRENREAMLALLTEVLNQGTLPEADRLQLIKWAHSLGVEAGAHYLLQILRFDEGQGTRLGPFVTMRY